MGRRTTREEREEASAAAARLYLEHLEQRRVADGQRPLREDGPSGTVNLDERIFIPGYGDKRLGDCTADDLLSHVGWLESSATALRTHADELRSRAEEGS